MPKKKTKEVILCLDNKQLKSPPPKGVGVCLTLNLYDLEVLGTSDTLVELKLPDIIYDLLKFKQDMIKVRCLIEK